MRQGILIGVNHDPGICQRDLVRAVRAGFPEATEGEVKFAIVDAVNDLAIVEITVHMPERDPLKMYFPANTRFDT